MTTKLRSLLMLRRCHTCSTSLRVCTEQCHETGSACCLFCAHPVTEGMKK